MKLKNFKFYEIGNTPIYKANKYCPSGNLYLKLEEYNPNRNIKDRTAYYLIMDAIETGKLKKDVTLVESSSGNLGLSLAYFAREIDISFICLVDFIMPNGKKREMEKAGIEIYPVPLGNTSDYRSARIKMAQHLDQKPNFLWTNQYDNPTNFRAHYMTTGREIWSQMKGKIDFFISSIGTAGTICGVGKYLKEQNPLITIIGVEPGGSTIFGGEHYDYLNVGAGMSTPSDIFKNYGGVIDYYCKVDDKISLRECIEFYEDESISVGITTGSVLAVALYINDCNPNKNIIVIAPDGGENYNELFINVDLDEKRLVDTIKVYPFKRKRSINCIFT